MSVYKVRELRGSDYEAVARVNAEGFGYDYPVEKTEARILECLAAHNEILLGVVDETDTVVGYIHGEWYLSTCADPMYNIMALAVLPCVKKTGLGRMLMEAFVQRAKENGAAGIRLSSGANRTDAHGFYEHMGFTLRKEQKNFRMLF